MRIKPVLVACCIALALSSITMLAQQNAPFIQSDKISPSSNGPDVQGDCNEDACTDYDYIYGRVIVSDGSSAFINDSIVDHNNGDHEGGLAFQTNEQNICQYNYAGGYKQPDGCYACHTYATTVFNGGSYALDWGTTTDGKVHCMTPGPNNNYGFNTDKNGGASRTAGVVGLAATSLPAGTSCSSGNGTQATITYGGTIDNPATTCANASYPIQWCTMWRPVNNYIYTCPYVESVSGTPLMIAYDDFQSSYTGLQDGVHFDFNGKGNIDRMSWTKGSARIGFL